MADPEIRPSSLVSSNNYETPDIAGNETNLNRSPFFGGGKPPSLYTSFNTKKPVFYLPITLT